jgi:hypothetical protein
MPSFFKNPIKIFTPSGYAGSAYFGSVKIWPPIYIATPTPTPVPTSTPLPTMEPLFTFSGEAIMTISGDYVYKM